MRRRPGLLAAVLLAMADLPHPGKDVEPPDGETFHGHLDKCRRCESQPFNMCPIGNKLLEREALAIQGGKT